MSVIADYNLRLQINETLASGAQLLSNLLVAAQIAADKQAGGQRQLSAGADTIDLTAMLNQGGGAVDFSGLKVKALFVRALTATAVVSLTVGASNGYHLFAASAGKIDLAAGEFAFLVFDESRPDVSGTAKTIDAASADVDAIYEIYVAGA